MGKTSLFSLLAALCPTYLWPQDNWYEQYVDRLFQIIL